MILITIKVDTPLPNWLKWNETEKTFSGKVPNNWMENITICLTATDPY